MEYVIGFFALVLLGHIIEYPQILIVIVAGVIVFSVIWYRSYRREKEQREIERAQKEEERKRKKQGLEQCRASRPYRLFGDAHMIIEAFSLGQRNYTDNKITIKEIPHNSICVWLNDYPEQGEKEPVLKISSSCVAGLNTPEIYRPQGPEKWEDYLQYDLLPKARMALVQRKIEQDKLWQRRHSPIQ